jgi:hypothetical protein
MSISYRTLHNDPFPYVVDINDSILQIKIYDWCLETFGNVNSADSKWIVQWNGFRFKEEAYVTWLIMRFFGQQE